MTTTFEVRGRIGRLVQAMATSQWFRRIGPILVPPLDRMISKLTGGRFLLGSLVLPMMVLHTVGRKSGELRTTPLACLPTDEGIFVVGSNFGREAHPAWTYNVMATPAVTVEFRGERFEATANLLDADEVDAVWPRLLQLWPAFDKYRADASGRDLRVFRVDRT